jgi:putative Mn2+ efflux pump MntP
MDFRFIPPSSLSLALIGIAPSLNAFNVGVDFFFAATMAR